MPWPVRLFLVALVLPWLLPIGPLTMPVYRLILLIALLPCAMMWVSGRAGRVRIADIFIIAYALWAGVCLGVAHGWAAAVEPFGALFVETAGAYLLARCYVRDADTFRAVVAMLLKLMIVILPFALIEWLTGAKPLLTLFGMVFPTVEITQMTPRLGLWRVQGPFAHSIEYGAFWGSMVALATMVVGYGRPVSRQMSAGAATSFAAMLSMSSAPIAGVFVQAALIAYDRLFRRLGLRWPLLFCVVLLAYLVVEFGSNQTPIQFYISKFTFDQQTGWYRLWIWEYGSASVANHPLFGIGLNDWVRPRWMPAESVDAFWLLTAMRYGLPALLMLLLGMLCVVVPIARMKPADQCLDSYRLAYLIAVGSFVFVGTTVHFWGALYCWFLFLIGSGAWFRDAAVQTNETSARKGRALGGHQRKARQRSSLD